VSVPSSSQVVFVVEIRRGGDQWHRVAICATHASACDRASWFLALYGLPNDGKWHSIDPVVLE